jgi:glutamate decarboxylase
VEKAYCLDELSHENSYLGKTFKRFTLHFSHSAAHIAAQHYNIQTLGFTGYQSLIAALYAKVNFLVEKLHAMDRFDFISPNHIPAIPGMVFTLKHSSSYTMQQLAAFLYDKGWHLPTFHCPHVPNNQRAARIVIRYGLTDDLMTELLALLTQFFKLQR